ncbi:hypothetical protein BN970_04595 [Mycolicibacterium conceptionense]|nr:hypothetical protein BN970_04595 [Mycolicibacterium conceptionense]
MASEPWSDVITGIATVDLSGMFALPTINGKELFGARLAFDLLGCCAHEEQVAQKLREYFRMVGDPAHMFLICAAALDTIASDLMPALLEMYEQKSGDYDARVRLANAARNAWAARVTDFTDKREGTE